MSFEKIRWKNLKFWQKGAVVGVIVYFLFGLPMIMSEFQPLHDSVQTYLFYVVITFFLVAFGMFGVAFKLSEFRGKSTVDRGICIGAYLPVIPLAWALIELTKCKVCEGTGTFMLIILIPVLAGIGGLIGHIYQKFKRWRG